MNSACVLWIDRDRARIFHLTPDVPGEPGNQEPKILRRQEILHHTPADVEKHKFAEPFFHDVAREIADATELLVLGPGLAKKHFVAHLEKHHHEATAKRVVGVETEEDVTDAQVLDRSRRFFRRFDLLGAR